MNTVRGIVIKNRDEPICKADVENITVLDVSHRYISSLDGIEYFTELKELDCGSNKLTTIDLSHNKELEILDCSLNLKLESLNISSNTELKELYCNYGNLTELDVSNNTQLTTLICFYNKLGTIDLSRNTALTSVKCTHNYMNSIEDVILWENCGLILGDALAYFPQDKIEWIYEPSEILSVGDELTVSYPTSKVCSLMLAIYEGGRLVELELKDFSKNDEKSISITLPETFEREKDWTLKAFAWDNTSTMSPLVTNLERML